jgi:T-complex protein 1 subunit theta
MMKDGSTVVDTPVVKNIQACHELAKITSSSLGPYGLCKMVINHLGKIFVTHDAATIINELEVEHPAAKLVVMASKAMLEEVGDGTNTVVTLSGELLKQAESLVRMGIHTSDIIAGYTKSGEKALELLSLYEAGKVADVLVADNVIPVIRTAIASKQYGYEKFLAALCTEACINACPSNPRNFNVDNIRVCKLDGESILSSKLVRGFVIARSTEGTVKHQKNLKVAMYSCAIDVPATETKGQALIETADQLMAYSNKEEQVIDDLIGSIAKMGVTTIVSNSNFGDMALHFMEKHGMAALKVASKYEMRRLGEAVGARTLPALQAPTVEDIGRADKLDVQEIGGKFITCVAQDDDDSKLSTLVIRGATHNILDDVERAMDDGINVFKALTKDPRLVAGAGAFEMEMAKDLMTFAEATPGLDQYATRKFATSFEVVARKIADVSGYNGTDVVSVLQADHQAGKKFHGVSIEDGATLDAVAAGIVDPLVAKYWAIKLATDCAVTVLQVDQIIVAKQAGGPKQRPDQQRDEE